MVKGRKVGTLTAGVCFVAFGIIFLLHTAFNLIDYMTVLKLWPVIIILLGIEILLSYIVNREEKIRFDGGAIALTIILTLFSFGMGFMEYLAETIPRYSHVF